MLSFRAFLEVVFPAKGLSKRGFANEQSYRQEREETWHTLHLASFIRDIIEPQACFGGKVHASETGHQTFTCRQGPRSKSLESRHCQTKGESTCWRKQAYHRKNHPKIQKANQGYATFNQGCQKDQSRA
jgi:hypothetical protein